MDNHARQGPEKSVLSVKMLWSSRRLDDVLRGRALRGYGDFGSRVRGARQSSRNQVFK